MNAETSGLVEGRELPEPAPALAGFFRVREPGIETQGYVGLDRNERLEPLPEWFMEGLRTSLQSSLLTEYPMQDGLHQRVADEFRLPTGQVLLTPGSDAAVKSLYHAYVRPGDGVVMLNPSYAMYPVYAKMFLAEDVSIPFGQGLTLDTDRLVASIAPGVRMVLIANPNQPTGTLLDNDAMLAVLQRAASVGALVVVDEAYYPFSGQTVLPLVQRFPHLAVVRTFSKASGLAGLRIGFVAASAEVVANLFKVRAANDINSFALLALGQVLDHPEIVSDYVAQVRAGGRLLADRASALGLTPLPTHANFMVIRVADRCQPAQLVEALKTRGYLITGPFSAPCLEDCVRVSLGPPDLMAAFADTLQQALAEGPDRGSSFDIPG